MEGKHQGASKGGARDRLANSDREQDPKPGDRGPSTPERNARLLKLLDLIDQRLKKLEEEAQMFKILRELLEERIAAEEGGSEELHKALNEVRWRRYSDGGEWCFADEAPEELLEVLKRSPEVGVEVGGYVYRLKLLPSGKVVVARRRVSYV